MLKITKTDQNSSLLTMRQKLSPENMDKKINTQKLAMYFVWINVNVIFRHFENQLFEFWITETSNGHK